MANRTSPTGVRPATSRRTALWIVVGVGLVLSLTIAGCGSQLEAGQPENEQPAAGSTTETIETTQDESDPDPDGEDGDGQTQGEVSNEQDDAVNDREDQLFPDVIDATASLDSDGTWTFSATISSPYDTPARYADAWRVTGRDGEVYGTRELAHDHQAEQPFTRSQSGIAIPDDVSTVTVEGRDQVSGWGGATVDVTLQR